MLALNPVEVTATKLSYIHDLHKAVGKQNLYKGDKKWTVKM
jgi:hypothetical protein